MSADLIRQALDEMRGAGVAPTKPELIRFDTPSMVRFHIAGDKPGSANGFARFWSDGIPAGVFGSWRTGQKYLWCVKQDHQITPTQRRAIQERIRAVQAEREAEQLHGHQRVSEAATARFSALPGASANHPYLVRKRIPPFTARQDGDLLVLAIQDYSGQIWSLQTIAPNGDKRMMKGGQKRGHFITVRPGEQGPLLICEGFATGCSLALMHDEAQVIAAIDAHNMRPVAEAAREHYPAREIILAADHDPVGLRCSRSAARAIDGTVLIPPTPGFDWNDEATHRGGDA